MTFASTHPTLARALAERNFSAPTPVQTAVLAEAATDRDLLVSAQTGSGKTVAYGLAIARNLLGDAEHCARSDKPLALIVAPTRELALQVSRELAWLYQFARARVVSCVGGMDPRREQRELAQGAHIVVGTPGRLCDHLRRGHLDASELKVVVLDEADEMLDMGFREDMEFILKTTPETRRTLLFSATLPRGIVTLAKNFQRDAFRIEVTGQQSGHVDIEYRAISVASHFIENAVVNILRYFESPGALVFCNTRNAVRHLQAALLERGFSVVALSGELTQHERTQALQSLRDQRARVCVATDVAARGIDLPSLGLVIHADLPHDAEVMQHRSGRTGRAGRKGVSVLLVPPARRRRTELMLRDAHVEASWSPVPAVDEIRRLDQQRMLQDPMFAEDPTEDDLALAQVLLAERSPEAVATALARVYRSRLPSPEEVAEPVRPRTFRDDRSAAQAPHIRKRHDDHAPAPATANVQAKSPRAPRESMAGGSVWFRASIGRDKNAEARWLLPMICRRGGIDKHAIGAIRVYESSTEFEIAGTAAEQFSASISRPDKNENIRIEPLTGAPQSQRSAPNEPVSKPQPESRPNRFGKPPKSDAPKWQKRPGQQKHPNDATPGAKPHAHKRAATKPQTPQSQGKKHKKKNFRG